MDMQGIAKQAVAVGMSVAGNAKVAAMLNMGQTDVYDPATDTTTQTGGANVTVLGLFYVPMQSQNTGAPGFAANFLVNANDIPAGTQINEADSVTINNEVWQIDLVEPILQAAWKLHLRK